ncbi:MAG: DNA repair protein RecN [Cardiobacteriaceae bacterium]|nr:DNA repair protein RecN [Cardiobacteriaceae bacterium]
MLEQLTIDQIAIIEHSDIHFCSGFNVLSGETGAGKSILIDALGLILGERADAGVIRHGQERANVSASFINIPPTLQQMLLEEALDDPDNPTQILIRRTLRDGSSKAWVNAQSVTGGKLKNLAASLIAIHGQHSNQALLKTEEQRRRLDRYAGLTKALSDCGAAYQHWQHCIQEWQTWQENRQNQEERLALLAYQLKEIEQIAPQADEFTMLSEQQNILASADEILAKGGQLSQQLYDDENSVQSALRHAVREAEHLTATANNFQEAAELLEQSAVYLDEACSVLNKQLDRIEHDPIALQRIEERMSALYALARKHHQSPENLHILWQTLNQEYQTLNDHNENGAQLKQNCNTAHIDYEQKAAALSAARKKAAPILATEVENWIRQLGMEKATFAIHVEPANRPTASGMDDITYALCANPGQTLQPLNKVASGGELSRVSLAIEVACLDETPVPTVIFDEIDAGIGGEVADTVGKLLHTLGKNRQVLCITHLPQVAAYADAHYRIEKNSDDKQTQTKVIALDEKERIIEIARMLGSADSSTSREHARSMLLQKNNLNPAKNNTKHRSK